MSSIQQKTRQQKRCELLRLRGYSMTVDHDPVIKHLRLLLDQGHNHRTIGEVSGVHPKTIGYILGSSTHWVTRDIACALFRVPVGPPSRPAGLMTLSRGTRRRLQALAVAGYPTSDLARRMGLKDASYIRKLMRDPDRPISLATAERVRSLYASLLLIPAPQGWSSQRTRNRAVLNGWHGAGTWDDIDNDDRPRLLDCEFLIELVRESPGMWYPDLLQRARKELGVTIALFEKLYDEALSNNKIVRVAIGRRTLTYPKDHHE